MGKREFEAVLEHRAIAPIAVGNRGGIIALSLREHGRKCHGSELKPEVSEVTASPAHQPERKLATILAADDASNARLMGLDEVSTQRRLTEHLAILAELATRHAG